jgi:hypothetical protein
MGATFNIPTKNTETRRYVKRVKNAGKILEGSSVIDIDDFVTGCKNLGVWNNMVCWPLRSAQNTGTNTAFSLGGLGTFDATLINGPTWGIDGVTLDGINDYIVAQTSVDTRDSSILQINRIITPNGNFSSYFGGGDSDSGCSKNLIVHQGSSYGGGLAVTQSCLDIVGNSTSNGNNFFGIAFNGGIPSFTAKTIGGSNVTITGNYNNLECVNCGKLGIGCHFYFADPVALSNISVSINILFNNSSVDLTNLIYPLYKSTLGKGLGLP